MVFRHEKVGYRFFRPSDRSAAARNALLAAAQADIPPPVPDETEVIL
jgi:hypothetical protein